MFMIVQENNGALYFTSVKNFSVDVTSLQQQSTCLHVLSSTLFHNP